jgi:hypothetical protein
MVRRILAFYGWEYLDSQNAALPEDRVMGREVGAIGTAEICIPSGLQEAEDGFYP